MIISIIIIIIIVCIAGSMHDKNCLFINLEDRFFPPSLYSSLHAAKQVCGVKAICVAILNLQYSIIVSEN